MTRKSLLPVLCISFLLSHIAAAQQGPTATSMVIHSRADLTQAVTRIQDDLVALDRSHQAMQAAAEKLAALYSSLARKAEEVAKAGAAVKAGETRPRSSERSVGSHPANAGNANELQPAIPSATEPDAERESAVQHGQQHHEDEARHHEELHQQYPLTASWGALVRSTSSAVRLVCGCFRVKDRSRSAHQMS